MSRLPALSAQRLDRILLDPGFRPVRQKGSHVFYRHPDGRSTSVPHHASRDIARPLLREILREIDITPTALLTLLGRG
jgi:predicted RNA binding protein YcfA (HicA-like mRNA interferase family)